MPHDITIDWLARENACGPHFRAAMAHFGQAAGAAPSWELVDAGRGLRINVAWVVCHLADDANRRALLAHTLKLRREFALPLLIETTPVGATKAMAMAETLEPRWTEDRDYGARSAVRALRDYARALAAEPSADAAMEAIYATRRAYDYAGLDGNAIGVELEDWLAERIIGMPRPA